MQRLMTMVLAGGKGKHFYPPQAAPRKTGVPFDGKCRIIDFPLMNCLNSGLPHVPVLFNRNRIH